MLIHKEITGSRGGRSKNILGALQNIFEQQDILLNQVSDEKISLKKEQNN